MMLAELTSKWSSMPTAGGRRNLPVSIAPMKALWKDANRQQKAKCTHWCCFRGEESSMGLRAP